MQSAILHSVCQLSTPISPSMVRKTYIIETHASHSYQKPLATPAQHPWNGLQCHWMMDAARSTLRRGSYLIKLPCSFGDSKGFSAHGLQCSEEWI